jgi:hypothetical protein
MRLRWLALTLSWAALGATDAALGELYECQSSDGDVRYVDRPDACPGAARYEPRSRVGSVAPPPGSAARALPGHSLRPRGSSASHSGERSSATFWQRKKAQAERELRQVESMVPGLERMAWRCNKGADAWYTDRAGLKHSVSCQEISAERDRARSEQERLRRYLEVGLAEECRRAGCLPGWIR